MNKGRSVILSSHFLGKMFLHPWESTVSCKSLWRSRVLFIKKNPTRCNNVSKFYYSIFIWSSTCFRRHTTHHQEPETALAASGFSYVEGCWTCSWWTLSGTVSDIKAKVKQWLQLQDRSFYHQCFDFLIYQNVTPQTIWWLCPKTEWKCDCFLL